MAPVRHRGKSSSAVSCGSPLSGLVDRPAFPPYFLPLFLPFHPTSPPTLFSITWITAATERAGAGSGYKLHSYNSRMVKLVFTEQWVHFFSSKPYKATLIRRLHHCIIQDFISLSRCIHWHSWTREVHFRQMLSHLNMRSFLSFPVGWETKMPVRIELALFYWQAPTTCTSQQVKHETCHD